jgi:hypothetical protein
MKPLKMIITFAGLAAIVAVFLPYLSEEGFSMSYWDIHKLSGGASEGLLNGPNQVFVALACFAIPTLMGLLAIVTKQLQRWEAIVALVFSLAAFACEGVRKGFTGDHGITPAFGGKLMFIAAAVGLVTALVGTIKPEPSR